MLNLRKRIALAICSVLIGGTVSFAQETPKVEPQKRVESEVRIINQSGGSGYLGVATSDVSSANFAKYGLSTVRGVAVENVAENSPAAKAGLQAGDVILKFNATEVTSVRQLTRLISEVAPDHQAKIVVWRAGSEKELTATMSGRNAAQSELPMSQSGVWEMRLPPAGRFPDSDEEMTEMRILKPGEAPRNGEFGIYPPTANGDVLVWRGTRSPVARQIGVGVTELTKQLGEYFGAGDGKGILVNNVWADSPAAKAGIKAGDIIFEVDGKPISSANDLVRAINAKKEGEITVSFLRDKKRQTINLTPEAPKAGKIIEKVVIEGE